MSTVDCYSCGKTVERDENCSSCGSPLHINEEGESVLREQLYSVFSPCDDCGKPRNNRLSGCPHCADRTQFKGASHMPDEKLYERCLNCKEFWPEGTDGCSGCGAEEFDEHYYSKCKQCGNIRQEESPCKAGEALHWPSYCSSRDIDSAAFDVPERLKQAAANYASNHFTFIEEEPDMPQTESMENQPGKGSRHNNSKTPFQFISPIALGLKGQVNAYANQKYGTARNWELGLDWLSVYDSMMRHLIAWRMGEDFDKESGLHHMVHAGWACDTLTHFFYVNGGNDDREGYGDQLTQEFKLTDMFTPFDKNKRQ